MKCAARSSLKNTGRKNSPSVHHRTTSSGYIFAIKVCIDSRTNILNSNIFPTCPHNMVNFGPLTAEIGSGVWVTPANLREFRVLASLLYRRRSTEVNQSLHDVWPSPELVRYIYIWGGRVSLTVFCQVQRFSRFDQQHSTEGATYIRLGGYHVEHQPTF